MTLKYNLIKISVLKTLLKPLILAIAVLPLFFDYDYIFILFNENIHLKGVWIIFFILLFLFQNLLIKRYTIIGGIEITNENITIKKEDGTELFFNNSDNLKIYLNYNGYRGEDRYGKIFSISEGIGNIEISVNERKFKFNFEVKTDSYIILSKILKHYENLGCVIDIRDN